jgi:basic amino acid/polyamine antiporter, APA family
VHAPDVSQADRQLVRAIGVPGLAANIINITIGASIFVLPAPVARILGPAAPLAFVICALAMTMFVTCFALAGSRVSLTGGPYAYIEVAFGRYAAFLAAVIYFIMALLAAAAVSSVLVGALVGIAPALAGNVPRVILALSIFTFLALLNVRGVRAGTGLVTITTVAKLLPLLLFIGAGFFFIKIDAVKLEGWPSLRSLGDSVFLLMFAFFGTEIGLVPSGEVRDPARTVPRAIYLALIVVTLVYILIQLVAQGTLGPRLAEDSATPLAEAAATFLGNFGRLLLLSAATVSAFGGVTSNILSSPRILFALGRDRILPQMFAHIHPRFHSPDVAIFTLAAVAFLLSVTSTFESLALMANVAALLLYALCCAAAWELMRRDVRLESPPFYFTGARIVPIISIALIVWLLAHATKREWFATAAVLAIASVLYLLRRATAR